MDNNSIYQKITDQILKALNENIIPWEYKYKRFDYQNLKTGYVYQGINRYLLALSSIWNNFESPFWITFNQVKDAGGFVKAGSKGSSIIFVKTVSKKIADIDSIDEVDEKTKKITYGLLKGYTVFNFEQCQGIDHLIDSNSFKANEKIISADDIVNNYQNRPSIVNNSSSEPCYSPGLDIVSLPPMNQFSNSDEYYSTLFHELIHSTGHEKRLNRVGLQSVNFGSENYSKEELIANIGSCFLNNKAGLNLTADKNRYAAIQCWIKVLKDNVKWIISAASQGEKACNYILKQN